ncbi:DUF5934 domain-containing protein [Cereibacter sphaeroides]|uniref:DUF5934 domain-containing protein n=1 Tax=Cereibacter sphaeroides TaxID=1063 RepID=UPI001FFC667A|nr:DUF5934 domain-containing protein [Cereibacter sphaeroides]
MRAIPWPEVAKIYRYAGLVLENDTFVQLPVFLAALPFAVHGKRMEDLKKLQRMKILKSEAASALAPIHGEWTGSGNGRGVLLLGGRARSWIGTTSPRTATTTWPWWASRGPGNPSSCRSLSPRSMRPAAVSS